MVDRYPFPHITHISQCLEAIKGCDAFHVKEGDRHTIINYHNMGNDVFPPVSSYAYLEGLSYEEGVGPALPRYDDRAAIRRECRGIVFGPDGRVIARRLHKFFNAGEREEVELSKIDLKDSLFLAKLDGSMITPIPIGKHIRWGTKMGLTEVGFQAEEFVSTHSQYVDFAHHCVEYGITPIFEWCSRKQRIVVDYPDDQLILLAVRNNVTGEYVPYTNLTSFGHFWRVPVVSYFTFDHSTVEEAAREMRENPRENFEGYVVVWPDGHAVKLKYEDYVRIHRAKDSIMQEKRVLEMVLSEKVDDVIPHLIESDRKALWAFQDDFWEGLMKTVDEATFALASWHGITVGDRKRFALESQIDFRWKSLCFSLWEYAGGELTGLKSLMFDEIKKRVSKSLGSNSRVNEARWMWQGRPWKDYIGANEDDVA